MFKASRLKQFDWPLFLLMFLLIAFGLVAQYSLDLNTAQSSFFSKQLSVAGVGLCFFFIFSFLDFRFIKSSSYLIYLFVLALLVVVLFFGQTMRGVKGWLNLGLFNFQVSELAKLALLLVLARFWRKIQYPGLKHALTSFLFALPCLYLIIKQPDLGSASVVFLLWLGILLLVVKSKKFILIVCLLLIVIVAVAWLFFLEDYHRERIMVYLQPNRDPLGQGYQITQSKVAIGSGQIWGRGFGLGPQSQLRFLPATNTDFIFATIGEEFGFIGAAMLLILYLSFIFRFIQIARLTYDHFGLVLILGIAIYFLLQAGLNIGMNIGLLPVIGVPLPLVSYGGSSLIVSMILVGLTESIILHQPTFTKSDDMISY